MVRIARALALYRGLVAPLGARPFCALRGPRRGGPLGAAAPGPGAHLFGLAPPGCGCVALGPGPFYPSFSGSLPPAWRAVCRAPRLPSPRLPSALLSVGRAPGFGLLGGREFLAPAATGGAACFPVPPVLAPAPLSRPARVWRAQGARCGCWRSRFAYPECDLVGASPCRWARPGRDAVLPLNDLVPCPSSCRYENLKTAIDKQTFVLYH